MKSIFPWLLCCVVSYLLGAMPTGFLVARARGVDIRTIGSGNTGATNVFRALGKGWGLFTLIVDALKGFVPARVFPMIAAVLPGGYEGGPELGLACAVLAIAGHNWPVYLGFKGGKGVATSAGALIGIAPLAALTGFAAWLVVFVLTRYVSLASMLATVFICAASWFVYFERAPALPIVFTALGLLLIWRHRSNIRRLLKGTENKIETRRKDEGSFFARRATQDK